jgi:hypothetical protein
MKRSYVRQVQMNVEMERCICRLSVSTPGEGIANPEDDSRRRDKQFQIKDGLLFCLECVFQFKDGLFMCLNRQLQFTDGLLKRLEYVFQFRDDVFWRKNGPFSFVNDPLKRQQSGFLTPD